MRAGSWASILLILAFAVIIAACHGKTIMLVGDVALAFGVSPAQASWVVSAVALIAALFSPIVNWIVAHTGERKSIVAGLAIAAVASYLGGLSQDFSHLLVLRVIEGAGYITVVLAALALILHTTEGKRRTTSLAFWSVASPLGGAIAIFAVSPYVGGEWRLAFSGHAYILLGLALLTPLLPKTSHIHKAEIKPFRQIFAIYKNPSLIRLAAAVGSPLTLALGLVAIVPIYFIQTLHVAPATIGLISTLSILSSVLAGIFAGFVLNLRIGGWVVVISAITSVLLEFVVFSPGVAADVAIAAKIIQGFTGSFVVAWIFTNIPKMSQEGDVMGAGGIAEQFLYISMFLGPIVLFPLFSLPTLVPFLVVVTIAHLLPLFLLPLELKLSKRGQVVA